MPKTNNLIYALNAGEVSRHALARVDLAKMRLAASEMVNWFPKVIGPAQFRPGTLYKSTSHLNKRQRLVPFIFSAEDTAQLELTDGILRPLIDGAPITRTTVSTTVTHGDFSAAAGWTLAASAGASSAIAGNCLRLDTLARGSTATARQQVTVAGADQNKEHAINIEIQRGPALFRVGSTSGGDEYITETELHEGVHSLVFTPTGNFWVQFAGNGFADRCVMSCQISSNATLTLASPWSEAELRSVRFDQSADVIFACHSGSDPKRIERRAPHSWSLVRHPLNDGPFGAGRTARVKLKPGASDGMTTLTSDLPFFSPGHLGTLFRLFHEGHDKTVKLAGEDQWTDLLRVSGVGTDNDFQVIVSGTFVGTLRVQRSVDGPDSGFVDISSSTAVPATLNISPGTDLDNVVHYYRVGFKPGGYTSGSATVRVIYDAGGASGVASGGAGAGVGRVLSYTSPTQVDIEVATPFFNTKYTADWQESLWSDRNGWPTAVALFEGRAWFGNSDKLAGSVSDGFNSFDQDFEGDAGPIVRSIATGPVNRVIWLLALGRLICGTSGAEAVPRSSSIDEPMTPTNFGIKDASTQGSADVQAVKVDRNGIFVQRSGRRLYELSFSSDAMDYVPSDLTRFNPQIASTGIVELAVQRQPDTRIWALRADGQVGLLTYEKAEEVACWTRVESSGASGAIQTVCVTPNEQQDDVWLGVKRTINGVDFYFNERLSYDENAVGGTVNEMADSAVIYGAVGSATLTGLGHLEGEDVVVWADGKPIDTQTFTVNGSGQITLPSVVATGAVVGLTYRGRFKSVKLAYSAGMGTAVSQVKKVDQLAPIMVDTHWRGPRFGAAFDGTLDTVPATKNGRRLDHDEIFSEHDAQSFALPGGWDTDSRVCVEINAPFPCTLLGFVVGVSTSG